VSQILTYLARDPERNVMKLLDLGSRIARMPEHREQIEAAKASVRSNPVMREFARRLLVDVDPNVHRRLVVNFLVNAMLLGVPTERQAARELGVEVPFTILIDPTEACNLRCKGCWAGQYDPANLPLELIDRVLREAKELGIYFIVLSGGEPTLYPHLFELASRHPDMAFMFYTNGTRIDDSFARRLVEVGNMTPAISLEGGREFTDARRGEGVFDRVMEAMDALRGAGAIFGFSVTVTRHNVEHVFADEFIDLMVEKGAFYGWSFHYVPIGRDPSTDDMITAEQRAWLAERVPYLRQTKPVIVMDFWNDGEYTNGCIAGGRRYFHINASGDVEPCAFVHFTTHNIRDVSLKDVLRSPLFRAYQKMQPFHDNMLRPCPIIDAPSALRDIVGETGARPSHPGADAVLGEPLCSDLDELSARWARTAEPIWRKRLALKQQKPAMQEPAS